MIEARSRVLPQGEEASPEAKPTRVLVFVEQPKAQQFRVELFGAFEISYTQRDVIEFATAKRGGGKHDGGLDWTHCDEATEHGEQLTPTA